MLFDVYGKKLLQEDISIHEELAGQIEAKDVVQAWDKAQVKFRSDYLISDVREVAGKKPIEITFYKPEGFTWYFTTFTMESAMGYFDTVRKWCNQVILYHVKDGEYSIYGR